MEKDCTNKKVESKSEVSDAPSETIRKKELLGKQLLSARKQASLSQEEAANRLGISRQTLSKWEMGKSSPDAVFIQKICGLYQQSADQLLDIYHLSTKEDYPSSFDPSQKNTLLPRKKRWVFLLAADLLICILLVSISKHMLFWVLNYNLLFLLVWGLVRIFRFLRR